MPTVLLDTDIVSFLLKGDTRAAAYMPLLTGNRLATCLLVHVGGRTGPGQDGGQGRFREALINQVLQEIGE